MSKKPKQQHRRGRPPEQRDVTVRKTGLVGAILLAIWRPISRFLGFKRLPSPEDTEHRPDIDHESLERGYEVGDVRVRPLLRFGVVLIVVAAVLHLALWGMFEGLRVLTASEPTSPLQATPIVPPRPQLQAHPAVDMQTYLEQELHNIHSYGWVDQSQGQVRIPIERAMELILERGLPTEPDATNFNFEENARDLDSEGGQDHTLAGTPVPGGPGGELGDQTTPVPEPGLTINDPHTPTPDPHGQPGGATGTPAPQEHLRGTPTPAP